MNRTLVIIDPQNDFCKAPITGQYRLGGNSNDNKIVLIQGGSLYVEGADYDMVNLSLFIKKYVFDISDIYVTLDDHKRLDIAHAMWWVDSDNNHPDPFTVITYSDVIDGKWLATAPESQKWSEYYLKQLDDQAKDPHTIWPYHCIAGTEGAAIVPILVKALSEWEVTNFKSPEIIRKGQSPLTEHYSAIEAEVVTDDPSTDVNKDFIAELKFYDEIVIAGEALSHCVANTVCDMIRYDIDPKKIVILSDCTSNVPSFEKQGEAFQDGMELIGVRFITTKEFEGE